MHLSSFEGTYILGLQSEETAQYLNTYSQVILISPNAQIRMEYLHFLNMVTTLSIYTTLTGPSGASLNLWSWLAGFASCNSAGMTLSDISQAHLTVRVWKTDKIGWQARAPKLPDFNNFYTIRFQRARRVLFWVLDLRVHVKWTKLYQNISTNICKQARSLNPWKRSRQVIHHSMRLSLKRCRF